MVHFTFKNGLAGKSLSAHNSFKSFIIMVVMLVMTASSVFAEVIDGLRYKLDTKMKTAILLPNTEKYSGDIVVPDKVKGNNGKEYSVIAIEEMCFYECSGLASIIIPPSVISIGNYCFADCNSLTSITIPSSVTSIGFYCFGRCSKLSSVTIHSTVTTLSNSCFEDCNSLTSITIPSSVNSLGGLCFNSCINLETVSFKGKLPVLYGTSSYSQLAIPTYCDIKVPAEYLQDYKDAFGPDYKYISAWNPNESGDDDKPVAPCATPSIFYGAGKLKFSSETAGAKYHYTISDKDMATDALCEDGNVSLSAAYDISVYATADGYSASEKAKATLYWINANLENTTNIYQARTRGVVASAHDGIVCISGFDNGEVVKFYAADGKLIGSSSAVDGTASCAVSETMVIAKFGDNAIKVAVK